MSAPEHTIFITPHHQHEADDPLTCFQCFKSISASRPPVFNADNCSCVEVGGVSYGGTQPAQPSAYASIHEPHVYHHEVGASAEYYPQQPQSYASSSDSVACPEGPEREAPNVNIANTYLPLAPETGHNEVEHRRSSSFRSNMSFQMRRYLIEPDHAADPTSTQKFLPQEVYIQSKTSVKSSKKSKPSQKSLNSSRSAEGSFFSWGVDPVTGIGGWIDQDGDVYCRDGYPMTMSGLSVSDFVFDE